MSENEKYNGWHNYETWKMHLNLSNEEGVYNSAREIVQEAKGELYEKAQALKEWVENTFWVDQYDIVHFSEGDSFTMAELSEIDWIEITKALMEELMATKKKPLQGLEYMP